MCFIISDWIGVATADTVIENKARKVTVVSLRRALNPRATAIHIMVNRKP